MNYNNYTQIQGIKFSIPAEFYELYQENHKITVLISDIMNLMKSINFSFDHELKISTYSSTEKIIGKIMINEKEKLSSKDGMVKFEILKEILLRLSIKYPEILLDIICNNCDDKSKQHEINISSTVILPLDTKNSSLNYLKGLSGEPKNY